MNRLIFLCSLCLMLFSGCKCINGNYIHEDDILYVIRTSYGPSGESRKFDFYYADKFGYARLPVRHNPSYCYKWANPFSCGLALVQEQNNEWKYIDRNGEVIIDASEYTMCWNFEEAPHGFSSGLKGLAIVCKNDVNFWDLYSYAPREGDNSGTRFGLINPKGQIVLPIEYQTILGYGKLIPELENIWWIRKDGLWGAINIKGRLIIPIKYQDIRGLFELGCIFVKFDSYWGLINTKGKTIFPFNIEEIGLSNAHAATSTLRYLVKQNNHWGIINEKGKEILPFIYTRWEKAPDSNTIRLHKEDGSSFIWKMRKDEISE